MTTLFAILGTALSMVYLVAAFAIVVGCIGHWVIERRKDKEQARLAAMGGDLTRAQFDAIVKSLPVDGSHYIITPSARQLDDLLKVSGR